MAYPIGNYQFLSIFLSIFICQFFYTALNIFLITPPPTPPRNGEGSLKLPPALSGKGAGGLGKKPLPQPLPGTERGVSSLSPARAVQFSSIPL